MRGPVRVGWRPSEGAGICWEVDGSGLEAWDPGGWILA